MACAQGERFNRGLLGAFMPCPDGYRMALNPDEGNWGDCLCTSQHGTPAEAATNVVRYAAQPMTDVSGAIGDFFGGLKDASGLIKMLPTLLIIFAVVLVVGMVND